MKNRLMIIFALCVGLMGVASSASASSLVVGTSYTQATGIVAVPVSIADNSNAVSGVTLQIQYDKTKVSVAPEDVFLATDMQAAGWSVLASITPPAQGNTNVLQIHLFKKNVAPVSNVYIGLAHINFKVLSADTDIPLKLTGFNVYQGATHADISEQYTGVSGKIIIGATE